MRFLYIMEMCLFHQPIQYSVYIRTHKHTRPLKSPPTILIHLHRTQVAVDGARSAGSVYPLHLHESPPQHNGRSKAKHSPPDQSIHLSQLNGSPRSNDAGAIAQSTELPGLGLRGGISWSIFPWFAVLETLTGSVFPAFTAVSGGIWSAFTATTSVELTGSVRGSPGASSGWFKANGSAEKSVY
jgi:hypothetical protein